MHVLRNLLLLVSFLCVNSVWSQDNFNRSYPNTDGHDTGWGLAKDNDGYVITSGSLCNSNTKECDYIIKTDIEGNQIWESRFGIGNTVYGTELQHSLIIENRSIVIFGTIAKTTNDDFDLFIMKLNELGDSIRFHELEQPGQNLSRQFHKDKFGSDYFLFGMYRADDETEVSVQVTKVDSLGNLRWQKNLLGDYDRYRLSCIDPLDDGGFLIGTTAFRGVTNEEYLEMLRIDRHGKIIWTFTIDEYEYDDCDNFYGYWLPNDLIMFKECRDTNHMPGYSQKPNQFVLMDTLGNFINRTIVPVDGDHKIEHVIQLPGGDLLGMGNTYRDRPNSNFSDDVAYAVRIGHSGGIVWERFYHVDDPNVR